MPKGERDLELLVPLSYSVGNGIMLWHEWEGGKTAVIADGLGGVFGTLSFWFRNPATGMQNPVTGLPNSLAPMTASGVFVVDLPHGQYRADSSRNDTSVIFRRVPE